MPIIIENILQKSVNLANLTTFRIGGPAKYLANISTKDELIAAIAWAKEHDEAIFVLGGGSNVLVNDQGVDGLVLKLTNRQYRLTEQTLTADAGVYFELLVNQTTKNGLAGLEWAQGVPGTVGGFVRGNAGAFGDETASAIIEVEVFDITDNIFKTLTKEQCRFGYRDSLFKQDKNLIIWQATFQLQSKPLDELEAKINFIKQARGQASQFMPSAGCFFKNLNQDQLTAENPALLEKLIADNKVKGAKIASGLIIDQIGLKGARSGGVQVSDLHANFIVNQNHGNAADVRALAELIKTKAKADLNINLVEEVEYFGF